jgi:nicotinamide phosphoribosyltransferase
VNPILLSDSYKVSHWKQYPHGTEKVYSYFESRGGRFPKTVFFGLQAILMKYLVKRGPFDEAIAITDLWEAREILKQHMPGSFNEEGWDHVQRIHRGNFPVVIHAVPEGSVVPTSNVLMTVENTCPKCFWVTNYLETLLSQVWYPMTVATQSYYIRQAILQYLNETSDSRTTGLDVTFKLHDFGFRGVSSVESAVLGGMAHLVNFQGSDTMAGVWGAKHYYNEPCAGFSIPASEHSTITSWGKDGELAAFGNMLDQYPTGLVACVSDSFNIYAACEKLWGEALRERVLARDGVLVIRPDSGNPSDVVMQCLTILGERFGYDINHKGFRVLNPKVRIIQGDGVDHNTIIAILQRMKEASWAAENIAFGMGGALLQQVDRDTQKCAFKCSWVGFADGSERDVFKQPLTDSGKNSKRGRLALTQINGEFATVREDQLRGPNLLQKVFENGTIHLTQTFKEVRERASR